MKFINSSFINEVYKMKWKELSLDNSEIKKIQVWNWKGNLFSKGRNIDFKRNWNRDLFKGIRIKEVQT